jgi:hypothetical protein
MTAGDPRMRITMPNDSTKGDSREENGDFFLKTRDQSVLPKSQKRCIEFDRKIVPISLWSLG